MQEKALQLTVFADELGADSAAADSLGVPEATWLLPSNKEECAATGLKRVVLPEQVLGMTKLAVATFCCLMWNIAGVLLVLHFCSSSGKDKTRLLAVAMASVPSLGIGSLLMWFLLCEWCKHAVSMKRRAWNEFDTTEGGMP